MNKEVAAKWTDALESDRFNQAKMALRRESGHCCLGVLCELYAEEKKITPPWEFKAIADEFSWGAKGCQNYLPPEVMEWAGIGRPAGWLANPVHTANNIHATLASLNDNDYTFKEIAAIIKDQMDWL